MTARRRAQAHLCAAAAVAVAALGCSRGEAEGFAQSAPVERVGAASPSAQSGLVAAQEFYREKCEVCHGQNGGGDGPGAADLNVKPRTFSDPVWQTSVTDEHLRTVIVEGGPAVELDETMAGSPDLRDQPELLSRVVALVRAFDPSRK